MCGKLEGFKESWILKDAIGFQSDVENVLKFTAENQTYTAKREVKTGLNQDYFFPLFFRLHNQGATQMVTKTLCFMITLRITFFVKFKQRKTKTTLSV